MYVTAPHGGHIRQAAEQFGIPEEHWLDLSTGINPNCYPLPNVPTQVWQRLPYDEMPLYTQAEHYYHTTGLLAVAGSQQAIEILPIVMKDTHPVCRVAILSPSYTEHAIQWKRHGHDVVCADTDYIESELDNLDIIVVVQPGNPTTQIIEQRVLQRWHSVLSKRQGTLVVDEAFMDAMSHTSKLTCIKHDMPEGLIVLRSIGKFFGLAGIRLGFVVANEANRRAIKNQMGLWSLSAIALWAGQICLADRQWHSSMRESLELQSTRLSALLMKYNLAHQRSPLFCYIPTDKAKQIHRSLAREGILVRLFDESGVTEPWSVSAIRSQAAIRIGIPNTETAWQRLEHVLNQLTGK